MGNQEGTLWLWEEGATQEDATFLPLLLREGWGSGTACPGPPTSQKAQPGSTCLQREDPTSPLKESCKKKKKKSEANGRACGTTNVQEIRRAEARAHHHHEGALSKLQTLGNAPDKLSPSHE